MTVSDTPTAGGFLLVLAVALPAVGVLLSLALGGRHAERIARLLMPVGLGVALAIIAGVWRTRHPLLSLLGGWHPPLGVALRADGLSAVMLVTTAVVMCAVGAVRARRNSAPRRGCPRRVRRWCSGRC